MELTQVSIPLIKSQLKLLLTLSDDPAGALKKLTVHGNQLREVSPALGQLQQLQELMLQGNQLRSIPPELFQLKVGCALAVFLGAICTSPACRGSAQTEPRLLWVCLLCTFITHHEKLSQESTVAGIRPS